MKIWPAINVVFIACAAAQSATAGPYNGSVPFICAPINIVSCDSGGKCDKETVDTVNLPQFLNFDVVGSKITGTRPDGEALATAIEAVNHVDDNLTLNGIEGHIAWSVMIAETSGDMILTAAGDGTGYVAFGACTSR